MTWKNRLMLRESVFTAIAFTVCVYMYYVIVLWGNQDTITNETLLNYIRSPAIHVEFFLGGILFGGLIGVVNRITEMQRLRRRPMLQVILVRTALYMVGLVVVGWFVLAIVSLILSWEQVQEIYQTISLRSAIANAVWIVLVVTVINFGLEVGRVLGPSNLWRLFIGQYRRPRNEERVFLFMDLKGSTSIAEQLGHERYSKMLQECYQDLTEVVMQYEAAIYQYVGDEVVLSWRCTDRKAKLRAAVHTSFAFQEALEKKRKAYRDRYTVAPEFRAGIDAGSVTAIEIGDIKREIAYHGDVLNTAARLLELGKARQEDLIVSQEVADAVADDKRVHTFWHAQVPLRGKSELVDAYSLSRDGLVVASA